MQLDDLLKTMLRSFFVITTGIITSMFLFCLILKPYTSFSLSDIGRVLLMAFLSDLPFVLFYSRKELDKRQMRIRTAIHFPVLASLLLYFAHLWDWVELNSAKEVVLFIALIIIVYAIVFAITSCKDKKLADKLNNGLKHRYHS